MQVLAHSAVRQVGHTPKLDPSDVNQEILEQYYFLHDNFVVTMGIYQDENVVFDEVTAEWKEYCQASLKFVIPEECLA